MIEWNTGMEEISKAIPNLTDGQLTYLTLEFNSELKRRELAKKKQELDSL